jgi:PAP2 superfamily
MKFLKVMLPLMLVAICSCKQSGSKDYAVKLADPMLYCKTVKKLNDVVLENNFPPVIASRNYVYANIAAYECVAASNNGYASLAKQIKHLPELQKLDTNKKVNFNLAALLSFTKVGNAVTFPEGSMMSHYEYLKNYADSLGIPKDILENTIAYSDSVAATIIRWSKKDNYPQSRTSEKYSVQTSVVGRWIPTPPMYASALEPHWNTIRTMVLDSAAQFSCPAPPLFDLNKNSTYYKALNFVKQTGDSLTEEQKGIADFWDDNPFKMNVVGHASYATKKFSPPGHWMNIVGIAAKNAKADFNTTVAAYTQTAITMFDGFISCWNQKYISNTSRPETVINKHVTDTWRPYIQTPPFPAYVSGHSTISAAAAEVMTAWFGDNLSFKDTSSLEFGIKARTIVSFRKASKEAGMSRIYGGIHFMYDNEEGNKLGTKIGVLTIEKLKMKK